MKQKAPCRKTVINCTPSSPWQKWKKKKQGSSSESNSYSPDDDRIIRCTTQQRRVRCQTLTICLLHPTSNLKRRCRSWTAVGSWELQELCIKWINLVFHQLAMFLTILITGRYMDMPPTPDFWFPSRPYTVVAFHHTPPWPRSGFQTPCPSARPATRCCVLTLKSLHIRSQQPLTFRAGLG